MSAAANRERELRRQFDALRFEAPNPRDFPNWEAFYSAQADHERRMGELEREIDAAVAEALS